MDNDHTSFRNSSGESIIHGDRSPVAEPHVPQSAVGWVTFVVEVGHLVIWRCKLWRHARPLLTAIGT
jgi:hypothetical protein